MSNTTETVKRLLPRLNEWLLHISEWTLVLLMVLSASFSAYAFWIATQFSEAATGYLNRANFAEADDALQTSIKQAQIAHDLEIAVDCRTAEQLRDLALVQAMAGTGGAAASRAVLQTETLRVAQESLILGNGGSCTDYSFVRALEWFELSESESGTSDPASLRALGDEAGKAENLAMVAVVVFAASLLLLELADSTAQPGESSRDNTRKSWPYWRALWVGLAALALLFGILELVRAELVADRSIPIRVRDLVVLVGWFAILWLGRTLALSAIPRLWPRVPARHIPKWADRTDTQWWAEVLGALTIVVFAFAAYGFTTSTLQERQAMQDAEEAITEADRMLELSDRTSSAALSFVSERMELQSLRFAAGEPAVLDAGVSPDDARRYEIRSEAMEEEWASELDQWRVLMESGPHHRCSSPREFVGIQDTTPASLVRDLRENRGALVDLVKENTTPSVACGVYAAVRRQHAASRGAMTSSFAAGLVALGLVGFMFAMVIDPDRSEEPRRWLLAVGVLGLVAVAIPLTLTLVRSQTPDSISLEDIRIGSHHYARLQQTHLPSLECEEAIRTAENVVDRIPEHPPAYIMRAFAHACFVDASWLINPFMDEDSLEAFTSNLSTAHSTDFEELGVVGNLGWAHLLAGLTSDDETRIESLDRAKQLTDQALSKDPANPFLCFNRALIALGRSHNDEARRRYEHALDTLAGRKSTGPCARRSHVDGDDVRFGYEDDFIDNYVRLLALADLELVDAPSDDLDVFRELLVGGHDDQTLGAPNAGGLKEARLDVFPQEVQLSASLDDPAGVIWYYREHSSDPWGLLLVPSLWTIDAGDWLNFPHLVGHPLPAGEYRADVYVDGSLIWRGELSRQPNQSLPSVKSVRFLPAGVSAVIPTGWIQTDQDHDSDLFEISYGDDQGARVSVRRSEAVQKPVGSTVDDWLHDELTSWLLLWDYDIGGQSEVRVEPDGYFLGLDHKVVLEIGDDLWAAAGHNVWSGGPGCPGTTMMAFVEARDSSTFSMVKDSFALEQNPLALPKLDNPYSPPEGDFSIEFPDSWGAVEAAELAVGSQFVAVDCETQTNVRVGSETLLGPGLTVAEYVDFYVDTFSQEFDQFELLDRRAYTMTNGVEAERITYRWISNGLSVSQTQVYAISGTNGYFLTASVATDRQPEFQDIFDQIVESFVVGPSPSLSDPSNPPNAAPVTQPDAVEVFTQIESIIPVLENDTDDNGLDLLSLRVLVPPKNGTAYTTSDGTITYRSIEGFVGEDWFTYRVCDVGHAAKCREAAVEIVVLAPTALPQVVGAPQDDECYDVSSLASNWEPMPIEVWRCDYQSRGLYAEYLRFEEPSQVEEWIDVFVRDRQAVIVQNVYDGTWRRGSDGPSLGRLIQWVEEDGGGYGLSSAFSLWEYDAEGVVALVWDAKGDMDAVNVWWSDNA